MSYCTIPWFCCKNTPKQSERWWTNLCRMSEDEVFSNSVGGGGGEEWLFSRTTQCYFGIVTMLKPFMELWRCILIYCVLIYPSVMSYSKTLSCKFFHIPVFSLMLINQGDAYSYIHVLPHKFHLNSAAFVKFISKEISGAN